MEVSPSFNPFVPVLRGNILENIILKNFTFCMNFNVIYCSQSSNIYALNYLRAQ